MIRKKPIGIGLMIAIAALAAMAMSAASAVAEPACTVNVLCKTGGAGEKIRDDVDAATLPPGHTEIKGGGGFGADVLATNTTAPIRLRAPTPNLTNTTPKGYAYFGLKIDLNPAAGTAAVATGWVEFADFQNSSVSPVFTGEAPAAPGGTAIGGYGPWPFTINKAGEVSISNVTLYFPNFGGAGKVAAAGTFTGTYIRSSATSTCPGGGIKLNVAQPGVTSSPAVGALEVDNGTAATNAVICFVSSNNYLFPKVAPEWKELQGGIEKD
jgi:hypothetical protein